MRAHRPLDLLCALFLLTLALAKAVSAKPTALTTIAAVAEAGLGLLFVLGWCPRLAAATLVLTGLIFAATTLMSHGNLAELPCGCAGDARLTYAQHVSLALLTLLLGALQCYAQSQVGRPGGPLSRAPEQCKGTSARQPH